MRKAATASASIIAAIISSLTASIFWTSLLVLNPSKKCMNGTLALSVDAWAIRARSIASWTELLARRAKPV
ncbi:MAG: hypothetical protein BWX47_01916 [candidate division Hyd24-12 bacterium ADurb.Bin004]|nr:MAG: hypothetical protein BWX47_01916 [candidate division Hyd24-12 bacterium ADurb.Bin004]